MGTPKARRTKFDISFIKGLEQKFDPRHAPDEVATVVTNFVKSKMDALQQRVGFTPLTKTGVNLSSAFSHSTGLNVGTFNERLVVMGQGQFSTQNNITTLSEFSDDASATLPRGLLSEVSVRPPLGSVANDGSAIECSSTVSGDYLISVWSEIPSGDTNPRPFFQVWECSTGRVVIPATLLEPSKTNVANCPQVITVGSTVVVFYASSNSIFARTITPSTGAFSAATTLVTTNTSADGSSIRSLFIARPVVGDSTNFALAFCAGSPPVVHVQKWTASTLTQVNSDITLTDATLTAAGGSVSSWGMTSGNFSLLNPKLFVAYGFVSSGHQIIDAADINWLAWTINQNGSGLVNVNPAGISGHYCNKIASVFLGNITGGGNSWAIAWSYLDPFYNSLSGTNATPPQVQTLSFHTSAGNYALDSGQQPRTMNGVVVVSDFYVANNGLPYLVVYAPSKFQGTHYLVAFDSWFAYQDANPFPMRPCGTFAPRQAIANPLSQISLGYASPGSGGALATIVPVAGMPYGTAALTLMLTPTSQKLTPTSFLLEFASRKMYNSGSVGGGMMLAAGTPQFYDGNNVSELGFLIYPEVNYPAAPVNNTDIKTNATGPIFTADSDVVNYFFTYEWPDANGNWHISARSPIITLKGSVVKAAVGGAYPLQVQVMFNIPNLHLTMKQGFWSSANFAPESMFSVPATIQIGVYRTQVNAAAYQRVNDPNRIGSKTGNAVVVYNSLSSVYSTFTDDQNDSTIASNFLPYADGTDGTNGNLDNLCPPSTLISTVHKGRLFCAVGNQVWYTKQINTSKEGSATPAFNEQTMSFFVGGPEEITILKSLDDKLIIGKRRSLFFITGEGPLDNGQSNDLFSPQPVPTELGCKSPQSSQGAPEGLYFMTDSGYRLLTRGMEVRYAGWSIEDILSQFPFVTGSVMHPVTNRMVVCASNTDTSTGQLNGFFIYRDYVLDTWMANQITDVNGVVHNPIAVGVGSAAQISGVTSVLHLLMADGQIWRENDPSSAAPFFDNGQFVTASWIGPWHKPQGPQGWARLWETIFLMESKDPHGLLINFWFDYNTGTPDLTYQYTWNNPLSPFQSIQPGGVGLTPLTQVAPYVGRRFETFRVQIQSLRDTATVTGQGPVLLNCTCGIGLYEKPFRVPPAVRS